MHRDIKVRAPDGTVLLTDAYVAAPGRPLPVILIRSPYGRHGVHGITDWITAQPWSDGTIGTFGGSYLTFTQFALASTRPPQLKAMAITHWSRPR